MIEMDGLNSWFPMKNTEVQKGSSIFFFIPWDPNKETWGIFFFFMNESQEQLKYWRSSKDTLEEKKKSIF